MNNTFITVTLRSFSFTNDPDTTPVRWIKEPGYHNTTVGFRVIAHFRWGLK